MSGHSKWSTIKRQKGAADVKKGQAFTKLANVITIAVKLGGSGNPDDNPRLQMAIETSRGVNMPKDNIQRAIDRGLGKLPGQTIEEVTYEGSAGKPKTLFNQLKTLKKHDIIHIQHEYNLLGNYGLMKPSLKPKSDQDFLWDNLDYIDVIESDHAPHTHGEKAEGAFGVPGLETTLPLLLQAELEGRISRKDIVKKCSTNCL